MSKIAELKTGTRVFIKAIYPGAVYEAGKICRPRKSELPLRPDRFIVKFDDGGDKLCIHRGDLYLANEVAAR